MDNSKPNGGKNAKPPSTGKKSSPPAPAAKGVAAAKPAPTPVAPMFRRTDWLVMAIVFVLIWAIYLFTLAPELTLEDSGELCTGAYYAGIPHPPGYPFWSIYGWLWTAILPWGNVAWRVEVGESFGIAMGCAMLALMVSRGSSMLIEGIEELRGVTRQWESAICMVSGFVVGMVVGLDGFVWGEAVVINRISIFAVPWLILVLLLLMRWMYAPHQRRYLYWAMLCYGICATIHQTLLLSAVGVEVAIALVQPRLGRDLFLTNSIIYLFCILAIFTNAIPALNGMSTIEKGIFHVVGVGSIMTAVWMSHVIKGIFSEWKVVLCMGLLWCLGVAFYFYEPIAGMTCPPMQWGYPRTVEGFFHALSRGQYEQSGRAFDLMRFLNQLWYLVTCLSDSFGWVFMFVGLLPFLFLFKMQKRERFWIGGLTAVYFCLSVPLVMLLDVGLDKMSHDLNEVFFTASHALFGIMIGYGMTLMAAYMATHYQRSRQWAVIGASVAVILALFALAQAASLLASGPSGTVDISLLGQLPGLVAQAFEKNRYGSPIFANLILIAMPVALLVALMLYRKRGPIMVLLGLFLVMPVYSGLSHWYKSEERNHWFGYWFGHDMFTPPYGVYPPMARNAILYGGTDPGRFCPTYMIFCESFIPHSCQPRQDQHFDRRDVYIITQNALADNTYLDYLRSQYDRSQQHDPPFFSELSKYIFSLAVKACRKAVGVNYDRYDADVNQYSPPEDQQRAAQDHQREDNKCQRLANSGPFGWVNQALYYVLDKPLTKLGKHIEMRRRAEGVYPPKEIYIPSPEDLSQCYGEYTEDFERRARLGQLEPGEGVQIQNGAVAIGGTVSVMKINGLLCRLIFDHNPANEFYIEESFPLDWMYPYETPYGIIMRIHRHPVPELTSDDFKKDHEFWSQYSERIIGNWITYDTTVQQIADFADKVYFHNNYNGFTGDRKFVRDEDAQKSFSKLRSSQAGMYNWRLTPNCPPELRPKTPAAEQALIRETDFAYKQAFAFCPYSPDAVGRYINFLLSLNRMDDALTVAETWLEFDPYNGQAQDIVNKLTHFKQQNPQQAALLSQFQQMQAEARRNPTNFQNTLALAQMLVQMQETDNAVTVLRSALPFIDQALADPNASLSNVVAIVQITAQMGDFKELGAALQKLVALEPSDPEARYDLAALCAFTGQNTEAISNLQIVLDLNARRLATNPAARNLLSEVRHDQRFNSIKNLPEFKKLVPPQ